jgi:hypothetical protein
MIFIKALLLWIIIAFTEVLQSIVRVRLLQRPLGDHRGRQSGVLTSSGIILLLAWFCVPWLGELDSKELLGVGLMWLVLMLGFEIVFVRVVLNTSWRRLAAAFDLRHGGLLSISLVVLLFAPLLVGTIQISAAGSRTSDLHRNEQIVFFPALGHRASDGDGWQCEIHGCVYEPEKRALSLGLLREVLDLKHVELTKPENDLLAERARLFMVDNQRGRQIVVRVDGHEVALGKSKPDGHFTGTVRLPGVALGDPAVRTVQVDAILRAGDSRRFVGQIHLVEQSGVSVISDLDDTIKITQVQDRKGLLRRTFLQPFQPVPGMAEVYKAWSDKCGATFHYVSASPSQLLLPLSEFVNSNGFPSGTFHLKKFRWKDESFLSIFKSPEDYKLAVIESLLQMFPRRQFVLVGDGGERDPETYATLARRYPHQIARILIRDVAEPSPASQERYQRVFHALPSELWRVFHEPAEIIDLCPPRPGG